MLENEQLQQSAIILHKFVLRFQRFLVLVDDNIEVIYYLNFSDSLIGMTLKMKMGLQGLQICLFIKREIA